MTVRLVPSNTTENVTQNEFNDIVICNIPWADLSVPFLAPAILKGIAESQGYKAKTIDFNIDLFHDVCKEDEHKWLSVQEYYQTYTKTKPELIEAFYDHVIDTLKNLNFKYLGISVFYIFTQKATWELCQVIRERMPEVKIVLGGKGLNVYSHLSIHPYLSDREKMIKFDKLLAERNLADYFIIGDAEDAIIDLLSGKLDSELETSKISDWYVPKKDNLVYPFANFDDYDFKHYKGIAGRLQLPIVSSKGCVRRCDFCDVPSQFKKFQSKDGKRMAEEVLFLADKYKNYEFTMADSIANGNLRSLKEFANIIADYNQKADKDKRIRWSGNWIHRPVGQLTEEVFSKIAESGAMHFTVGAEHFSDSVLTAMNKKTTNAGLFHELELFKKYKVQCGLNNIIGHWSETFEAFMEHVDATIKLGPYFASETAVRLRSGLFYIMKNTPAEQNKFADLVSLKDDFSLFWYNKNNPSLTLKSRVARLYFFMRLCKYLNIPSAENEMSMKNYVHRIKEILPETMDMYKSHIDHSTFESCSIFEMLPNLEKYADEKTKEFFPSTDLKIKFNANSCKGDPGLCVKINGEIKFKEIVKAGPNEITIPFVYDYDNENQLEMSMFNKNKNDTVVDNEGNIIEDKSIILEAVELDGVNFVDFPDWYNKNIIYTVDGQTVNPMYGFWSNSSLQINFPAPFWRYFQSYKDLVNKYDINICMVRSDDSGWKEAFQAFENLIDEIEY